MSSKHENILVTGGAGFIGSHLVHYHLAKGDHVWVIDNLTTGQESHLIAHPHLRFDCADVTVFPHLKEAILWADKVYHLAATLGMYRVLSDPIDTLMNNICSTERIFKIAHELRSSARFMIASSSGVYAHTSIGPEGLCETDSVIFPSGSFRQESYYLSKMVNELTGLAYACDRGIWCVAVRYFNVIGPHQTGQYGMVVPRFVQQALQGQPLTVFGDGLQSRCFINVEDAVKATHLLLQADHAHGQIVNVGLPEECTILDLARRVIKQTGSVSSIVHVPYKEAYGEQYHDVTRRVPCIKKLQQLTGFTPQLSLDTTLEQIILYFQEQAVIW